MFFKFFLTLDSAATVASEYAELNRGNLSSTHSLNKKENHEILTFDEVLYSYIRSSCVISRRGISNDQTREILINISDEAMFQLEALSVPENCYCTYNVDTKLIGFGNTIEEAECATLKFNFNYGTSFKSRGGVHGEDLFFNYYPEIPEVEPYHFVVPDAFYDQVLEELKPYIINEKLYIFKKLGDYVLTNINDVSKYFESFYEDPNYKMRDSSPLSRTMVRNVIRWFMNDDIDITSNKDILSIEYSTIGMLCRKIMHVSFETF